MEGVMENEAVEGLARALATEFPVPESYEAWQTMVDRTYQSDAAMLLGRLRADPAAARAVRDALDPDGLAVELAAWQHAARIGARAAGVPRERVEPCGHCGHMHWFGVSEAEAGSCGACPCEMWTEPKP